MNIAIGGGTGFIGKALTEYLLKQGHDVTVISRKSADKNRSGMPEARYVTWDQLQTAPELLEGTDAIVNLAGASLNQRWTPKAKQNIMESRLTTVHAVAKLVQALREKPAVVIQGSAVAVYGTSLTDTFREDSAHQVVDFPSSVV